MIWAAVSFWTSSSSLYMDRRFVSLFVLFIDRTRFKTRTGSIIGVMDLVGFRSLYQDRVGFLPAPARKAGPNTLETSVVLVTENSWFSAPK